MKIEFEIDDKYKDTNLYLIWGMVPIARRLWKKQYWEIKKGFCSECGECCKRMKDPKRFPFTGSDGCIHLNENNLCSLKIFRPVGCSISDAPIDSCTLEWVKYDNLL